MVPILSILFDPPIIAMQAKKEGKKAVDEAKSQWKNELGFHATTGTLLNGWVKKMAAAAADALGKETFKPQSLSIHKSSGC